MPTALSADSARRRLYLLAETLRIAGNQLDDAAEIMKECGKKKDAKLYRQFAETARETCQLAAPRESFDLPKLRVGVFDDEGKLIRTIEKDDPRESLCHHLNGMIGDGKTVRPID